MDRLDLQSKNIVDENIEFIGKKFPNCIVEGKNGNGEIVKMVDFDLLKQELSKVIVEGNEERYVLNWPDKKQAILTANAPISKTLRPVVEDEVKPTGCDSNGKAYLSSGSVGKDGTPNKFDSENLYIEGDNLDVLKLLRETYLNKIKMIYIDPPYNTGNDFVYEDDFAIDAEEYLQRSNQIDEQGNRLSVNNESNGRFHTDWLNMIYPRLKLARDLLTDDGVIFINIGEQEVDNLKKISTEIFGANNFIETYIWESTFRPDNSSPILRRNAEYVICLAKKSSLLTKFIGEIKEKEGLPSLTKASMKESVLTFPENVVKTYLKDGIYAKGVRDSYELLDDVIVKSGIITNKFRLKGHMIWGQEYLLNEIKNGTEIIIKSESFVPYTRKQGDSIMSPTKIIPKHIVGDILSANTEFAKLFDSKVFSYPKPVTLIKYLINYLDKQDGIILDFFSGSASTAHAVMQLNAEDGGNRKFIMVQLPEVTDEKSEAYKAGYKNICEIGKERIRRAGKKIIEEKILQIQKEQIIRINEKTFTLEGKINLPDVGFRVLKLDSSNMKDVYYKPADIKQDLLSQLESNIKEDRSAEDLLFQVMLDLGVPLSANVERIHLTESKQVFNVNDGNLMCCFDICLTEDDVTKIAKMKPLYAVFRDSSFVSDSMSVNFNQIFETYSPNTIRKVL